MAAGGAAKYFCEKATCSLCREFFRDPVTLAECGHSFCRACLTRSRGEAGAEASCPQCGETVQEGDLRPNQQLANFVGIAKKFRPQDGKERDGKEAVCEKHQEPLELYCRLWSIPICLVCERSKDHRFHEDIPLEEAFPEIKCQIVIKSEEKRICEKHQEHLKLFCKDDDSPLCMVCIRSEEHKYHTTIPFEEAVQEYKDQICGCLEILKKEKKNVLTYKAQATRESLDLLKATKAEKEKAVAEFQQLRQFLEQQEKLLLARMEEMEKEIARRREEHLAMLSEELSSLESLIQELEEKSQQAAHELLQDTRGNLQSYKKSEYLEAFPAEVKWRIWDLGDIHPFLETVMKQFKGTLISGPQKLKANVTLDPDTAHRNLILSADRKSVRLGNEYPLLPDNPKRFCQHNIVLGQEGFTSGQYFWEVTGSSEGGWSVGVAKKSVKRTGNIYDGIWAVQKMGGYMCEFRPQTGNNSYGSNISLKANPRRIRVCLNYDKGQVAFFDADTADPIHTFSGASFSRETLFPLFWVDYYNAQLDLSF